MASPAVRRVRIDDNRDRSFPADVSAPASGSSSLDAVCEASHPPRRATFGKTHGETNRCAKSSKMATLRDDRLLRVTLHRIDTYIESSLTPSRYTPARYDATAFLPLIPVYSSSRPGGFAPRAASPPPPPGGRSSAAPGAAAASASALSNGAAASSTHCHPGCAATRPVPRAVLSPALSEGRKGALQGQCARCRRSGWNAPGASPGTDPDAGGRRAGTGVESAAAAGVAAGVRAGPAEISGPGDDSEGDW